MNLTRVLPWFGCAFQTHPYYSKMHSLVQLHPMEVVDEFQRTLPVERRLFVGEVESARCTAVEAADLVHHTICVITQWEISPTVRINLKTGEIYVSIKFPCIDVSVDSRTVIELPCSQKLIRVKDFLLQACTTITNLSDKFETVFNMQFRKLVDEGKFTDTQGRMTPVWWTDRQCRLSRPRSMRSVCW